MLSRRLREAPHAEHSLQPVLWRAHQGVQRYAVCYVACSVPRGLPHTISRLCGPCATLCAACYTWMRRHFQVEPNGKHVRCAEAGILDRCAAMLEDFAKAGVYPGTWLPHVCYIACVVGWPGVGRATAHARVPRSLARSRQRIAGVATNQPVLCGEHDRPGTRA